MLNRIKDKAFDKNIEDINIEGGKNVWSVN